MNKAKAQLKFHKASVPKSRKIKIRKSVAAVVSDGYIHTMVSKRIDELSLPPMRTLLENKEQFKRILTDRAAESIARKLNQPEHCRCGENEDSNLTFSCFGEPKYKRKVPIDKVARDKFLSHNKLKTSASGPSRIEILSKPLKRRLPEPVSDNPIICNVKPSTLRYVANERILELAQPKKVNQNMVTKKKRTKKSVSRYTRSKNC